MPKSNFTASTPGLMCPPRRKRDQSRRAGKNPQITQITQTKKNLPRPKKTASEILTLNLCNLRNLRIFTFADVQRENYGGLILGIAGVRGGLQMPGPLSGTVT